MTDEQKFVKEVPVCKLIKHAELKMTAIKGHSPLHLFNSFVLSNHAFRALIYTFLKLSFFFFRLVNGKTCRKPADLKEIAPEEFIPIFWGLHGVKSK